MRFTKIPLIATLMTVALSLLIVLPSLAQENQKTDGQLNNVDITVGVFANIADAELVKMVDGNQDDEDGNDIFVPGPLPTPAVRGSATHSATGESAWLLTPASSPQDTFFKNTLYVSNKVGAFNTVLINVANDATENCVPDDTNTTPDNEATFGIPRVSATVKNNRSNESIKIQLALSGTAGNFQAFFKVVESGATGSDDEGTPTDTSDDTANVAYGVNPSRVYAGPTWCDDERETRRVDVDDDSDPATPSNDDSSANGQTPGDGVLDVVARETAALTAVYGPVQHPATTAPGDRQEIATIFARHGDRLTVTTDGGSGQVQLLVDGQGPDISAVTPEDNAVVRPGRLTFAFEVRDDDSGLRHDGEPVTSPDGDLREINPDGDANLASEPLSKDPGTTLSSVNGAAQDIDVNVLENPMDGSVTRASYTDISASGSWRTAASRAGVAYSFTASGAGRGDDDYLYQVVALDRAGNETVTDADDRANGDQPYVFRVDDEDPELQFARTGISYDTEDNEEVVDRSYIMLDFGGDALGDVDTNNITVVGSTIVGLIHPTKAPRINRGETPATTPPSGPAPTNPGNPPTVVTDPSTRTPAIAAPSGWSSTFLDGTDLSPADPNPNREDTTYVSCTNADTTDDPVDTTVCPAWAAWTAYENYVSAKRSYDDNKSTFDNYNRYNEENPGRDIADEYITEPRSRIYLELAEDLASDAEPTVLVVGGAVFDLASNTNPAKTLSKAQDWIAPTLTVTATGTMDDRPVANSKGSFTIDVRSDEDVARRPTVFFVTATAELNSAGDGYGYTIAEVDMGSSLTQQEDDNHWARKYKSTAIGDGAFSGLVGVVVLARDENDNSGAAAGWSPGMHQNAANPAAGNKLDLSKMDSAGLLLEIDDALADASNKFVTPRSDGQGADSGKVTESANPFIKLEFRDEAKEYNSCDSTDPADFVCGRPASAGVTATPGAEFKDSHGNVNVTEITLNGDNVLASLARVDKNQFSLVLRDLVDGSYTVAYTATDDAGNEIEGSFKFSKEPRDPYEIEVRPGWNLVSLPATPVDPAIGSVLEGNQYITPVLGYQDGDWVTAIQQDDGTWRGRLETIEGGFGYWVHARTFESIETMLSEADPAGTLPTVPVTAGWNLLGVLDIFQNAEGEAPGTAGDNGDEADNYFSSIPWKVAYTYDTTASLWVKTTPGATAQVPDPSDSTGDTMIDVQEILNGNGYWVWSPEPSTLVP